jgi:hypothetical protein
MIVGQRTIEPRIASCKIPIKSEIDKRGQNVLWAWFSAEV